MKFAFAAMSAAALLCAASAASASVVFDRSPDAVGLSPGFTASNYELGQNFLVAFQFATATEVTGADIYSDYGSAAGTAVTIKFRGDDGGAPGASNLYQLSSVLSAVDNDGSASAPSIKRYHADFAPIVFGPGNYWFGMSGASTTEIGWNLEFGRPGSDGAWQLSGDSLVFSFDNNVRFAYRLTGGAAVAAAPEPASWALMIAGFGLAGGALRRRKALAA